MDGILTGVGKPTLNETPPTARPIGGTPISISAVGRSFLLLSHVRQTRIIQIASIDVHLETSPLMACNSKHARPMPRPKYGKSALSVNIVRPTDRKPWEMTNVGRIMRAPAPRRHGVKVFRN